MDTVNPRKPAKSATMWDPRILGPAAISAFAKLDPRLMVKNPVMFVVEVVAALTTVIFLRELASGGANLLFTLQIIIWLWFTVLFANFAEAVAEGRGKAQADSLRRTRTETQAKLVGNGDARAYRIVAGTSLKVGDIVLVEAGDVIPSDGEVIEGIASVNEAAITGESAPVIREVRWRPLRGHRRHPGAVGLDTRAHHRGGGLDLHRSHDQARRGRRAAEDAERDRAQYPARRPHHHFRVRHRDHTELRSLRRG